MDGYAKIRVLGEGSFGLVYLMREKAERGGLVCVKDIPVQTKTGLADSIQEARLLARLSHPNIVAYKDAFVARNQRHYYIVMQYCSGVCLGLHAMHAQGILHRDIKSHNVFISNSGQYILGDLGISRELTGRNNMASTFVGTPYFLSPEQCAGERYTFSADVWALGCLLYELCALTYPFTGATTPALLSNICSGFYAPIHREYSFGLQKLVLKMLAVSPSSRPNVAEVLQSPLLRAPLQSYLADLRKCASKTHLAAISAQLTALELSDLWTKGKSTHGAFLSNTTTTPMPQYAHVEVDMADWLEKERQRHLLQILEHIKASQVLARAPPLPPQPVSPPPPVKRLPTVRPSPAMDPEWQPPVQVAPHPTVGKRHGPRHTGVVGSFRRGVPLTNGAKTYLAAACKDVRVLRAQAYQDAARARDAAFAVATAAETKDAWAILAGECHAQLEALHK
ncbi:NEK/NEK1 protein kinase [Saprolegnia parasitica CBS 223.65]|uniref:non-specific serine/threonine protein kinase n=1 Tax=Saprolegnia parasitica (strain CBS 223.65) TaxID=695850 RepID=A0A067C541_SAPPC|nr:NEK/NEK1 protein kinase [Saprolegnia parasitica CBS 223.65]KDO25899.1 NEK/NEK1 protein kinase [Saprolegnia parasitica CBS 223.65]|eukprot:XP_012203459.1 NEK/NEK1 protein kinase [Saprolegnia parasitica CBS 223.65]